MVTFADIDNVHKRVAGTAGRNFRENKKYFIEGTDFFEISKNDVATKFVGTYGFNSKAPKGILITESGYLLLAKSFTDKIAWQVQRELVNAYFRVKNNKAADDSLKQQRVETAQINANARRAMLLLKIAETTKTDYKQVLQAHATKLLTGEFLLPLPEATERTYSAGEIGAMLGVSAQKIGRLSNENGMKTEYYGKWFYDKAKSADKQVETFRYFERAIAVFEKLLAEVA